MKESQDFARQQKQNAQQLLLHALWLAQLNQQFKQALTAHVPAAWLAHCKIANVHELTLVLSVDSAAWASRMRYQHAKFLQIYQSLEISPLPPVQRVLVRVHPTTAAPLINPAPSVVAPPPVERVVSAQTAQLLTETAESVEYAPLQAVLQRLAKHKTRSEP